MLLLFWEDFTGDDFCPEACDDFLADELVEGFLLLEVEGEGEVFFEEEAEVLLEDSFGFWEEVEGLVEDSFGFWEEVEGLLEESFGFWEDVEALVPEADALFEEVEAFWEDVEGLFRRFIWRSCWTISWRLSFVSRSTRFTWRFWWFLGRSTWFTWTRRCTI